MLACLELDWCRAVFADNCFLHVYLGLSTVLGGLPAVLKGCALGDDNKRAQDLRAMLRACVRGMMARAERGGASVDDKNKCVVVRVHELTFAWGMQGGETCGAPF